MADLKNLIILMRGAGEMASGVAHRLWRSGFKLIMTELETPLAVRRAVSFCEAVHDGQKEVEGALARRVDSLQQAPALWSKGELPVLVDPGLSCLAELKPDVLIEASLSKLNDFGLRSDLAPLVIALGPGFSAPDQARFVIETNRGHNLGRVIEQGQAETNTGRPGSIEGFTVQRVFRAPAEGVFETDLEIGHLVKEGQEIGRVAGQPVTAGVNGMIRGLIRPQTRVWTGLKVGDVDPRGERALPRLISEKARALGGSVLECILRTYNT
ncbi:MAG: EF2563 family selenium-dependent molybdenum hydroxylase system protein [Deltaproteobacteria bacterium]|nr:EF2563 family selenium-dependent molybdenum hydroxylase system protein [Deltaproteobacteria bacterium]